MFKKVMAKLISISPFFRPMLYRVLLGYDIKKTKIGYGTYICVDKFESENVYIGRNNHFRGGCSVVLRSEVVIADENLFSCGDWSVSDSRGLFIGQGGNITSGHFLDLSGGVTVGEGSWLAGRAIQIWTHGAYENPKPVTVGSGVYIGSRSTLLPGSGLGAGSILGAGSVLTKDFAKGSEKICGNPARVIGSVQKDEYEEVGCDR